MVTLTSPDRRLWPQFTKRDLWDYFERVADRLLPQLADRPLSLKRFPRGVTEQGFFQKHLPDSAPNAVGRFGQWAPSADRRVDYALISDVDGLRWLAQVSAVELHPALARTDHPDRPDHLVLDLDPAGPDQPVARAARWVREVLDELELRSLVKTSGKAGLHVLVPVQRRYEQSALRGLALAVARLCADRHPDALTVQMRKAGRGGRLLLDWSRNGPTATLAAAWSPRAHPSGSVAMPLHWEEVTDDLDPQRWTLSTAPGRDDAWTDPPSPQRLERATAAVIGAGYPVRDASPRARTPEA